MAQPLMSMKLPMVQMIKQSLQWPVNGPVITKGKMEKGRVFTSLYGASEDLLNPGYRRMIINGVY